MKTLLPLMLLICLSAARAEVPAETYSQNTLSELPEHTLLINTFNARALVYDADTLDMLGMLSLGIGANAVEVDRRKDRIYVAENYFSRHTRGERTDVVTSYQISTLAPVSEVVIPPKHASGSPMRHYSGIVTEGDTQLMLVVNITPAVSLSVVDLPNQAFLGEISTAGCGLVYPQRGLGFYQLCGDGTAQLIRLKADGSESSRQRSDVFFDLEADPLMEKGVRTRDGDWLFNTFKGQFFRVSTEDDAPVASAEFSLADLEPGWLVGGMQPLAYHTDSNLLLVLVHADDGSDDVLHTTHKDPGEEIWYIDLGQKRIKHRLPLESPITSIQVSQDASPLLYAGSVITNAVEVYDLKSTGHIGTIEDAGFPTILQNL